MKYVVLLLIAICAVIPVAGQIIPQSIPEAAGRDAVPIVSSPRGEGLVDASLSVSAGGRWQPIGGGLDGRVLGMATLNDELYTIVEEPEMREWTWTYTLY